MVFSIGLVFLATWTVVKLAPEAAGGGVAEVMAYLNGCQLPKAGAFCCLSMSIAAPLRTVVCSRG